MTNAPPQKYQYKAFASIRLLKLYRDQAKALCGQLQNFDLDNGRCPKFTTISYVWGEAHYTNTIQVDGAPFPVLENAFPLLEALCDHECFREDRWVWIDSICINQDDVHERALQVQLMGRIYRESTKTVIWLASGTRQIQTAIRHLHELAVFHQSKYGYLRPEDLEHPGFWDAITRFFQHPWWARVWTLQEFILPSALRFQCGGAWIGFEAFNDAMEALYNCSRIGLGSSDIWGVGWGRRRVRHLFRQPDTGGRLSLVALLAVTGSYQCKDPRDRIYSLLGLAREEDQGIVGQPDYSPKNTVEAVYTKLVANFIKVFGSLDIICFAPIFTSQSSSGQNPEAVWPSWLPDWRVQARPQVVPLTVSPPSDTSVAFGPVHGRRLPGKQTSPATLHLEHSSHT